MNMGLLREIQKQQTEVLGMLVMAKERPEYVKEAMDQLRTMIQASSLIINATEKYPMSIEEIEQECEIRKQIAQEIIFADDPEPDEPSISMVRLETDLKNDCLEVIVQYDDSHEWIRLLSHSLRRGQIYTENFYGKTEKQALADYERAHGPLGD